MHNLSGYDSHLFIKELGCTNEDIDLIPNNEEKYITFTKHVKEGVNLRFVDSFRFMSKSLASLAKNLKPEQITHTRTFFEDESLKLVSRKGVYPYDYMDSWDKFNDTQLPKIQHFFNSLEQENITKEDYEHAKKVWNHFKMKTMGDYHDLYLKTDVLLLADVFECFRTTCMKAYDLDPAWYYTSPGLAWDAMLKMTRINLDMLTDYDMILMIEKGIRGGISQCCQRYAKANNKYMKDYDPNEESTYLAYLDANNLYGWGMSQFLPYKDFKWLTKQQINELDIKNIPKNSKPASF